MFFSVTKQQPSNFDTVYRVGDFFVGTDAGWQEKTIGNETYIFKGYADLDSLENLLATIADNKEPTLIGNFCVLVYSDNTKCLSVKTDRYRGFPIFVKKHSEITNLKQLEYTVWSRSLIDITPDLDIIENKFSVIGQIDSSPLTFEQALTKVDAILTERTKSFLRHNQLPIRVFLSGGVDSMLVYSYLQKYTDEYELVKCQHVDYDRFWLLNSHELKKYWGYSQIHHWTQPCVLTSGAPGDEFMLRSPVTANAFLQFYNTNVLSLLELPQWKSCLHYSYFTLPKHVQLFSSQEPLAVKTHSEIVWKLCNYVVNDWQHWHIGNTLTWTPLRDLEIFKTILRMPFDDCVDQILDSKFSLELIRRNDPSLISLISNQKNTGSYMSNLADFVLK